MKKIILMLLFFAGLNISAYATVPQDPTPQQHFPLAPIAVAVTTSSAQTSASNILRTGMSCSNLGTASVFIAFGANPAIVNGGTVIFPSSTWWMDSYLFTTQAINMISTAAVNVACQEYQ